VAAPKPALYQVLNIVERTDITPRGEFVKVMEISAVTKSGIEFTVTIPKIEFTKKRAAELLRKEAEEIEATLGLTA